MRDIIIGFVLVISIFNLFQYNKYHLIDYEDIHINYKVKMLDAVNHQMQCIEQQIKFNDNYMSNESFLQCSEKIHNVIEGK